jgi:hypothetical protein
VNRCRSEQRPDLDQLIQARAFNGSGRCFQEIDMRNRMLAVAAIIAALAIPVSAMADETGLVGGAIAGGVVGGPIGAAAGAVIGNGITGPHRYYHRHYAYTHRHYYNR